MKRTLAEIRAELLVPEEEMNEYFRKLEAHPDYPAVAAEFDREYEASRVMHKARTRARLTQGEIAAKMGTTQSAVSRMERGRVTYITLCKYIEACGAKLKLTASF